MHECHDPRIAEIPDYLAVPGGPDLIPPDYETAALTADPPETVALEAAALGVPVDTELVLPAPGLYGTHTPERRFGAAATVAALQEVGDIWQRRHGESPIGIGDISKRGGGDITGHASHERGIDVDIRLQRGDARPLPVRYQDPAYSRPLTQELVDIIRSNAVLAVKFVFFNDPAADGVSPYANHDNHLHVRFHAPGVGVAPPVLAQGSRQRPAVRELQRRLNFWIRASGSALARLVVDGSFGPKTAAAVQEFQRASAIEIDGQTTATTWRLLPRA